MQKVIFVTGSSGTGKSSLIPVLKKLLGENWVVYDFDEIWKPYDFSKSWEQKVIEVSLQKINENSKIGFNTMILGLIRPDKVEKHMKNLPVDFGYKFIFLDVAKDIREKRLIRRGASTSLIQDLEEVEGFRKWAKENDIETIDTSNHSINDVAKQIANYVFST